MLYEMLVGNMKGGQTYWKHKKKQNPRVNLFFAFLWCRPASAQYCFPASKFASCFLHKHLFPTKSPFRKFLCQHGKILFTCALSRCRSKIFKNIQRFSKMLQNIPKYSKIFQKSSTWAEWCSLAWNTFQRRAGLGHQLQSTQELKILI